MSTSVTGASEPTGPTGASTVETAILAFLGTRFPVAEIDREDDIFALGFVNSLFAMELVMFVEREFSFTVPGPELRIDNFRSVATMAALVRAHGTVADAS